MRGTGEEFDLRIPVLTKKEGSVGTKSATCHNYNYAIASITWILDLVLAKKLDVV